MINKPSPQLQNAVKEIVDILDKYDIGGYITLASKTHGEYLLHFPKWSKAFFEETPTGDKIIRVKSKAKEDKADLESTIHMIQVFEQQGRNVARGMDQILEALESQIVITGGPRRI